MSLRMLILVEYGEVGYLVKVFINNLAILVHSFESV